MIKVVFVEASTGGVVGGSLTGLYHLIRGLDRTQFAPAMVLYEPKAIEADLRAFETISDRMIDFFTATSFDAL